MSDTSQGPGWWVASDGKWYPPENHPDYIQGVAAAPPPSNHPPQPSTTHLPPRSAPVAGTGVKIAPMQWAMLGAGAVAILGVLTTWVTASAGFLSLSENGISSGDGKLALLVTIQAPAGSQT